MQPLTYYLAFLLLIWLVLTFGGIRGLAQKGEEKPKKPRGKMKILLMVPCKGTDMSLERNLRNAMVQDYPNYKTVAIVESRRDSAFRAIKSSGIDYLIADFNCKNCSGKVRNLATAIRRFKNYDAYCILDSDVNAESHWLSDLAAAMGPKTGISTAFPVFNPIGGFWSKAKHIWGFVGQGLMENPKTRFGWGGSLLFRKELMENGGLERFSESVSDDIAITKLCKERGFSIAYAPAARPVVDSKKTAGSFMESSNRQTAFSVLGDRKIFYVGLVYYSAGALLLVSSIILSIWYSPWFMLFLIPFVLFVARSFRRSGSADPAIIPICFLLTFIYLYNIANSAFMRRVEWRGRSYQLR